MALPPVMPPFIAPGTHLVNTQILPGLYRGNARKGSFASWARLSGVSGASGSILANGIAQGQFYIRVLETDFALETEAELEWLPGEPAAPAEFPKHLEPGMYIVGSDIAPGLYRGYAADACFWKRLSDIPGSLEDIIVDGLSEGQFYIRVLGTDFALETDAQLEWLPGKPAVPAEFSRYLGPGMYIVGSDIAPGLYQGYAADSGYWARLSDVTGSEGDCIVNGFAQGQFYIRVLETDFALDTQVELEWQERPSTLEESPMVSTSAGVDHAHAPSLTSQSSSTVDPSTAPHDCPAGNGPTNQAGSQSLFESGRLEITTMAGMLLDRFRSDSIGLLSWSMSLELGHFDAATANAAALELLARHVSGDWGDVEPFDARANVIALEKNAEIVSIYPLDGLDYLGEGPQRVVLLTEADRSVTTLMSFREFKHHVSTYALDPTIIAWVVLELEWDRSDTDEDQVFGLHQIMENAGYPLDTQVQRENLARDMWAMSVAAMCYYHRNKTPTQYPWPGLPKARRKGNIRGYRALGLFLQQATGMSFRRSELDSALNIAYNQLAHAILHASEMYAKAW